MLLPLLNYVNVLSLQKFNITTKPINHINMVAKAIQKKQSSRVLLEPCQGPGRLEVEGVISSDFLHNVGISYTTAKTWHPIIPKPHDMHGQC